MAWNSLATRILAALILISASLCLPASATFAGTGSVAVSSPTTVLPVVSAEAAQPAFALAASSDGPALCLQAMDFIYDATPAAVDIPQESWAFGFRQTGHFNDSAQDTAAPSTAPPTAIYDYDDASDSTVAPKSAFRGGKYSDLSTEEGTLHRHHMPAKQSSPLAIDDGPAIQMRPGDHRRTASYGGRAGSVQQTYRDTQKALIDQGKFDDAFLMDVDDIQSKFGNTYDEAILEAIDALPK